MRRPFFKGRSKTEAPASRGTISRYDRLHSTDSSDQRTSGQKDRDRILYSAAFRRLAGVTQVASPSEGDILHNRLTHSLKVAQVARRLSEKLIDESENKELIEFLGGIDPEVVEAAALAHDLGHPPFGHVAETTLDECLRGASESNGYEGNAQTFRILNKIAFGRVDYLGLNLSRATLNAILKYPWLREASGKKSKKFSAYHTEDQAFEFARKLGPETDVKSVEAELMDWADDITYSVHDMEDFYEAGLIPLGNLATNPDERTRFLDRTKKRWAHTGRNELEEFEGYELAFENLMDTLPVDREYEGALSQRDALKPVTSVLVGQYIRAIKLREPTAENPRTVEIDDEKLKEITMLKELTWNYVISSPALASQQHGYREIIRGLFNIYRDAVSTGKFEIIPAWFKLEKEESLSKEQWAARTAADIVSSLTDNQAVTYFQRLKGISPGSLKDWL